MGYYRKGLNQQQSFFSNEWEPYSQKSHSNAKKIERTPKEATYIPASLQTSILQWYHTTLQHPRIKLMQATLKEIFYWLGIDAAVKSLVRTWATCQKCKLITVKKYGKIRLPPNDKLTPWEEIHIDLIGPWDARFNSTSIHSKSTIEKIQALTIILARIHCHQKQIQLSHHPPFQQQMALPLPKASQGRL